MNNAIITFLASFLIWFLYAGLLVLWVIDGKIKKEQVIHAIFAVFVTWIISEVIKAFSPTIRPFLINGKEPLTFTVPMDGAFPSLHTMSAFALSVTIFMHDRKVGWLFLIAASLIGMARVAANVHYPVDIVGGALLGTLVAVIVERAHFSKLFLRTKSKS